MTLIPQLILVFLLVRCQSQINRAMWVGGVTSEEARFSVLGFIGHQFALSMKSDLSNPVYRTVVPQEIALIQVNQLQPLTRYFYGFPGLRENGTFQTFEAGPWSFKVTFSSTAASASTAHTWGAMLRENSHIFIHMGDLHCDAIQTNNPAAFQRSLVSALVANNQKNFYRSTPVAYMWDDLDFGRDASSPTKSAALTFYDQCVPHYPYSNNRTGDVSPYQAWTIGNVRFVMPDLRSEAILQADGSGSIMSFEQMEWLLKEISTAPQYSILVVISSRDWIGGPQPDSSDPSWGNWPQDRRQIGGLIATNNISNVLMIAGNAGMLAFDDGTHSDYSGDGGGGFPVMQSGPLDRWGSCRGGPYTIGPYGLSNDYNEQYSTMEILEKNNSTCVRLVGKSGEEIFIEWEKCTPFVIVGQEGEDVTCSLEYSAPWTWAVFGLSFLLSMLFFGLSLAGFKKFLKHETFKKHFILIVTIFFSVITLGLYCLFPLLHGAEQDAKTRAAFLPCHTSLVALAWNSIQGAFLACLWSIDFDCTTSQT